MATRSPMPRCSPSTTQEQSKPMTYALKTADNSDLFLQYGQPVFVTDPAAPSEFWPVDDAIPDDHHRTGWALVDGVCTATTTPNVPDRRARLASRIASRRWEVETGGISISGMNVATDDRSKLLLSFAQEKAASDPAYVAEWKAGPGVWVNLNLAQLSGLKDAVFYHVTACFEREKELSAQLAATADADLIAFEETVETFLPKA